ncbi:hypothetical protein [Paenibacillus sp. YYML68]|uniref:hypothetical protein n=1 Tax=Paenibacillus sp. YYML68 TaxID=2909250 RepID=UPI002493A741|nr:hypothetical protein [Paenibacillus sp. YYML68]
MYKSWIVGLIGVLLMAGSAAGYWYFMKHTELALHTVETIKPVRLLQSGEVIEPGLLQTVRIAQAAHHPEAVTNMSSLIGLTVQVPISEQEELLPWKLTHKRITPLAQERYFSFKTDAMMNVNNTVRRGDRVDVWVELEQPKSIITPGGVLTSVGAVKIIEQLPVASVKTAEGQELTDSAALTAIVPGSASAVEDARGQPNGKPELNTFLMNDEVYEAYVLGTIGGQIKLALPDYTAPASDAARVTELYLQLKEAEAFVKTKSEVNVRSDIPSQHVQAKEPQAAAGAATDKHTTSNAHKEVKRP